MLEAPEDLTAEHISAALRRWWGIDPVDVNYAAVGHGSHNWIVVAADATKWFVKADRKGEDTSAFFHSTYETAAVLRDGGLDFVHAAVRDRSGQLRREASPSWEIGVFPFIDGRNPDFHGSAAERAQIAETIGRLHAHPPTSVPALRWESGYRQPTNSDSFWRPHATGHGRGVRTRRRRTTSSPPRRQASRGSSPCRATWSTVSGGRSIRG